MTRVRHIYCMMALAVVSVSPRLLAQPVDAPRDDAEAVRMVERYLRATDNDRRGDLLPKIEKAVAGDVNRLANVLGVVDLWQHPGEVEGTFACPAAKDGL